MHQRIVWVSLRDMRLHRPPTACGLIAAVVPPYAFQPIILVIGLFIVSDAFATAPKRHLPACVFGVFPALADFVVSSGWEGKFAGDSKWIALQALAKGALMLSVLWTCILVSAIDAKFLSAAAWCVGGACLSSIGMIHQAKVDFHFKEFTKSSLFDDHIGTRPKDFVIGYMLAALAFLFLWAVQSWMPWLGLVPPPMDAENEDQDSRVQDDPEEELNRLQSIVDKWRGYKHLKHRPCYESESV